jgi:hypothetical protein
VMSSSAQRPASAAALLFVEWLRRLGTDAALDHVLTEVSEDQPIQAPTTSAFASTHAAAASPGAMP